MIRPVASVLDAVRAVRELVAAWNDRFGDDGGASAGAAGASPVGGPGILVGIDGDGNIRLASGRRQARRVACKVLQVQGGGAAHTAPDDPANVLYKVVALEEGWTTAAFVKPYYGRPSADGEFKIIPAKVGDDCEVVRGIGPAPLNAPYARLEIKSERLARRNCG